MKKQVILSLDEKDLLEIQRVLLDEDEKAALQFLKKHAEKKINVLVSGEGH